MLKAQASVELAAVGRHPLATWTEPDGTPPSPWARNCWKVFLNTDEQVLRSIDYVVANPGKEGKRPQRWSFVIPFLSDATV